MPTRFDRRHPAWPALLAAALACALTWAWWQVLPVPVLSPHSDYLVFYRPVAQALASGRGWAVPEGLPVAQYPPGYPAILAALFWLAPTLGVTEAQALRLLTLACTALSGTLLYLLARRFTGSSAALLGVVLWAAYPPNAWLTLGPNSELPFAVLLILVLSLLSADLQRAAMSWRSPAAGALLGAALLVRPLAALQPLACVAVMAWRCRRSRLRGAAGFLGSVLLVVSPWIWWVHGRMGVWTMAQVGPASVLDGLTYGVNSKGYRSAHAVAPEVTALMEEIQAEGPARGFADVASRLLQGARRHPAAAARLLVAKAVRPWYATDSGRHERFLWPTQLLLVALIAGAARRGWRRRPGCRPLIALLGASTLAFWAMAFAALSILRYMTPVLALWLSALPVFLGPDSTATEVGSPS